MFHDRTNCETATGDVQFVVIGYGPSKKEEERKLEHCLLHDPAIIDGCFLVHLGNAMAHRNIIDEEPYVRLAELLRLNKRPTLLLPGRTEWMDTMDHRESWRQQFIPSTGEDNGTDTSIVASELLPHRQQEHPENFVFIHHRVLFIGLLPACFRCADSRLYTLGGIYKYVLRFFLRTHSPAGSMNHSLTSLQRRGSFIFAAADTKSKLRSFMLAYMRTICMWHWLAMSQRWGGFTSVLQKARWHIAVMIVSSYFCNARTAVLVIILLSMVLDRSVDCRNVHSSGDVWIPLVTWRSSAA